MTSPNVIKGTLVESLLKTDPKSQEELEKAIAEKHMGYALEAAQRNGELIGNNSTKPVTISSIRLLGPSRTRRSFLDSIFEPLLSANRDEPYKLSEALQELSIATNKLRRHGIFHDDISMFIDKPDPTNPSSTPSDIDIYIRARERGVITLKTGTDLGNAEGSAYGNAQWRNIFGGAETLNVNAATGTRTRSAYQATFETPILSDPDKRVAVDILSSSTGKPWASHEEVLKGGGIKYSWASVGGSTHQVGYNGVWRQVTGLAGNASPTIRNDAGDTVKSSISHTWLKDERNHPILPNQGYFLKTISEIAGWGPLKGDVGFWKSEIESSGAVKVPGISGASLTAGIRAGMLYPLGVGFGTAAKPSRINDRFQLGGPTDVRGFKIGGLGPRDRQDAVGGDIYAASSINLLLPLPRVDISTPLRLQLFANAGRLLALKTLDKNTNKNVYGTIAELGKEIPSLAVGIGMVYAHPVARFELNFGLPIVVRKGEETRKGLQFGNPALEMAPCAIEFSSALDSSSYQSPDGGSAYAPLRKKVIDAAIAMGYDAATMVECGVSWSDDHDPFQHVKNAAYVHYVNQCKFREFQSFEPYLGKEKFQDMLNLRHMGPVVKTYTIDLKRPVKFPDALIIANHITEVLPDRYVGVTSIWSLKQQVIVADCKACVVFFDYDRGVPANLLEAGGVYKELYEALKQRSGRELEAAAEWEKQHPKTMRSSL
ncbi:hypothetical protein DID88_009199 [Monilinia fructigena]|uniref:Bacterial surface antigen (D15) domain-containing protein n=1 Tax=Monilinia fructigena TaxID=38457 RepID=A0A395IF10_9HELO|nr:hypothetical protein DID88_009199 [Monilinia fructigena]